MAWLRLDDATYEHPKILTAGPLPELLYYRLLQWSQQHLSDGVIPTAVLDRVAADILPICSDLANGHSVTAYGALARVLIDVGLLEETDTGYSIHDYLDYQDASHWVQHKKGVRAAAGSKGGSKTQANRQAKTKQTAEQTSTHQIPVPKPIKKTTRAKTPSKPDPVDIGSTDVERVRDHFIDFWKLYPRKVAKPAALRAWKQATRKSSPDAIMAGLGGWIVAWDERNQPEFIPHPATWLNQERWNDPTNAGRRTTVMNNQELDPADFC